MIIFSTPQFGFISLHQSYCTGSSLMPQVKGFNNFSMRKQEFQKQNPDALELIRGKSTTMIGVMNGFMTNLKGLPSGRVSN